MTNETGCKFRKDCPLYSFPNLYVLSRFNVIPLSYCGKVKNHDLEDGGLCPIYDAIHSEKQKAFWDKKSLENMLRR